MITTCHFAFFFSLPLVVAIKVCIEHLKVNEIKFSFFDKFHFHWLYSSFFSLVC